MGILIGFKQRIMLASTLLIAVALLVSNWVSYNNMRRDSMNELEGQASALLHLIDTDIQTWLSASMKVVHNAKELLNSPDTDKKVEIAKLLVAATTLDAVNFADQAGQTVGNSGVISDYDATQEDWYKEVKLAQKLMITDIYFDKGISDKYMFSFLDVENGGVIGGDIFLDAVDPFIKNVDFRGATIQLYDGKGGLISTSGNGNFGDRISDYNNLTDLESQVLTTPKGEYRYQINGFEQYVLYSELELIGGKKWHLVINIDGAIAYDFMAEQLLSSIITMAILIALTILLLLFTLNKIYHPIVLLKQRIADLAEGDGDLTQRLEVTGEDDLAQISQHVNEFISQLQLMMREILNSSGQISQEIEQLKLVSESNGKSLTAHTSETEQTVTAITQMSASANGVAESAKQTALNTQQASNEAMSSKELVTASADSVKILVNQVDAAAGCINTMNENTQEIVAVLSVIGAIADQTNLLALNAAIEAARAGEQGRGFAVVADEVRSLAARTQSSTAEINEILCKLTSDATLAVNAMDTTKDSCQLTTDNTIRVGSGLDTMAESIIEINELSTHIANASSEQSSVAEEISRSMSSIQDMVSDLTNNGSLTMESTDKLLAENTQLVKLVSHFKLS